MVGGEQRRLQRPPEKPMEMVGLCSFNQEAADLGFL